MVLVKDHGNIRMDSRLRGNDKIGVVKNATGKKDEQMQDADAAKP